MFLKTLWGSFLPLVSRSSESLHEAQWGNGRDTPLQRPQWAFNMHFSFNNFTFISANDWGSEAFLWVTFLLLKECLHFTFMGSSEFSALSHIKTHPWDFHLQTSETNASPQGGMLSKGQKLSRYQNYSDRIAYLEEITGWYRILSVGDQLVSIPQASNLFRASKGEKKKRKPPHLHEPRTL